MKIRQMAVVLAMFALAVPLEAQMGMRPPSLSGVWHPTVGSGASYERSDADGKKSQIEITIVGKEDADGKAGYWMEMAMANLRTGGDMFVKSLVTVADSGVTSTRTIMQMPGQDPMEIDMSGMPGGRRPPQNAGSDIRDKAEVVGTETVTVPAGTFTCQHYRMKDGSADAWVTDQVTPWGLVKMQGKDTSMVLTKVITDAKDHITGTPKKFDPMQMMRGMGQQGQQGQ